MKVIDDFNPSIFVRQADVQTVWPTLFRKVTGFDYKRERINTPDDDFLDLDWAYTSGKTKKLVIVSHGLEGNTGRHYVKGMVKHFLTHGWDALAWNFRGCSGEPNRQAGFYHSGASYDLRTVINHVLKATSYDHIALVGFSMGGNITLKYLGEESGYVSSRVRSAMAFSVPVDLTTAAVKMARFRCKGYMQYFLKKLHKKIKAKQERYPDLLNDDGYSQIKTFKQFDDRYTAPLHGFRDAEDYWQQSSALKFMTHIKLPTVLINAKDDPFLSLQCFPSEAEIRNENVQILATKHGGHVGFWTQFSKPFWSEKTALKWSDYHSEK